MPINANGAMDYMLEPYFNQHKLVHAYLQHLADVMELLNNGTIRDIPVAADEVVIRNQNTTNKWHQLFKIDDETQYMMNAVGKLTMTPKQLNKHQYQLLLGALSHNHRKLMMEIHELLNGKSMKDIEGCAPLIYYTNLSYSIEGLIAYTVIMNDPNTNYQMIDTPNAHPRWDMVKK